MYLCISGYECERFNMSGGFSVYACVRVAMSVCVRLCAGVSSRLFALSDKPEFPHSPVFLS